MHYRGPLGGKGWGGGGGVRMSLFFQKFQNPSFRVLITKPCRCQKITIIFALFQIVVAVSTMFMSFVPVSTSLMSLFKATSLVEILP